MDLEAYINSIHTAAQAVRSASAYALARSLLVAWRKGRTVFTCGNGGSYSNAQHLAQDLCKGTWAPGRSMLKTYHLGGNPSFLTAQANDEGYETVFAADLGAHGQPGDLLIAISGSGNSENVLNAVREAHDLDMHTWGVCGFGGGALISLAHRYVHVPCGNMGQIEVVHDLLFHWLVDTLHETGPRGSLEEGA